MRKRSSVILTLILAFALLASLGGCSSSKTSSSSSNQEKAALKIGIVQIVEHPSLNTIRESFVAQLEAKGYKDGDNG